MQEAGQPAFLLYGGWLARVGSDPTHIAEPRRASDAYCVPTALAATRHHGTASLEPPCRSTLAYPMGDPRLPLSLTPVADLLEQAARARRLATAIGSGDPAAPRLIEIATELEAEAARLSRLE